MILIVWIIFLLYMSWCQWSLEFFFQLNHAIICYFYWWRVSVSVYKHSQWMYNHEYDDLWVGFDFNDSPINSICQVSPSTAASCGNTQEGDTAAYSVATAPQTGGRWLLTLRGSTRTRGAKWTVILVWFPTSLCNYKPYNECNSLG